MKTITLALGLIFAAAAGAPRTCAAAAAPPQVDVSTAPIVFPGAPAKPRIRHVRSIRHKDDLTGKKKKGFFSRLISLLSGGDTDLYLFTVPYDVWVHDEKVYVTDTGAARLTVLDLRNAEVIHIGEAGEGRLIAPVEVAVDDAGGIYVTDSGDQTVKAYSPTGKLLWKADKTGGQPGGFNRPAGISMAPEGGLLVADKGNRRVVLLSKEGKFIRDMCRHSMREPLALPNPVNLWVNKDGSFIVSDPLVSRVHIFTSTGAAVSGFGERGDKPGYLGRPRGVAADSDGNIHVVDGIFHRVQMFNPEGQLLMWYANPGGGPAALALPSGIFIDKTDRIYVADTKNRRLQIFQYITYPDERAPSKPTNDEKAASEPAIEE